LWERKQGTTGNGGYLISLGQFHEASISEGPSHEALSLDQSWRNSYVIEVQSNLKAPAMGIVEQGSNTVGESKSG